jgi:hypothetical protein
MKKHTIDIYGLIKFQVESKLLYANSTKENKYLYCNLRGGYEVWHNNEIVLETMQAYDAVVKYNSI